jgi:hypothetical protein
MPLAKAPIRPRSLASPPYCAALCSRRRLSQQIREQADLLWTPAIHPYSAPPAALGTAVGCEGSGLQKGGNSERPPTSGSARRHARPLGLRLSDAAQLCRACSSIFARHYLIRRPRRACALMPWPLASPLSRPRAPIDRLAAYSHGKRGVWHVRIPGPFRLHPHNARASNVGIAPERASRSRPLASAPLRGLCSSAPLCGAPACAPRARRQAFERPAFALRRFRPHEAAQWCAASKNERNRP